MDWLIYAGIVTLVVLVYTFIVLKLMREQSYIEGRLESLKEDVKMMRAECYALRERLKTIEGAKKGE